MTKKEKRKLAEQIFNNMDSDGPFYYMMNYDSVEDLKKLGFDADKIEEAKKSLMYIDCMFNELEEMAEEI